MQQLTSISCIPKSASWSNLDMSNQIQEVDGVPNGGRAETKVAWIQNGCGHNASQFSNFPSFQKPADHGRYPAVSGGAKLLASLDTFEGFWQFPLDVNSQAIFLLLSDIQVLTPSRDQHTQHMLLNQGCSKLWENLCTNACSFGSTTFWFLMGIRNLSGFPHKSFRSTWKVQYQVEPQEECHVCTFDYLVWEKDWRERNLLRRRLHLRTSGPASTIEYSWASEMLGSSQLHRNSISEFAKQTFSLQELLNPAQVTMQRAKA